MTTSAWIFSDWQWGIYSDTLYMRWGRYYEDAIRWYWAPIRPALPPVDRSRLYTHPAQPGDHADVVRWTEPRHA